MLACVCVCVCVCVCGGVCAQSPTSHLVCLHGCLRSQATISGYISNATPDSTRANESVPKKEQGNPGSETAPRTMSAASMPHAAPRLPPRAALLSSLLLLQPDHHACRPARTESKPGAGRSCLELAGGRPHVCVAARRRRRGVRGSCFGLALAPATSALQSLAYVHPRQ